MTGFGEFKNMKTNVNIEVKVDVAAVVKNAAYVILALGSGAAGWGILRGWLG